MKLKTLFQSLYRAVDNKVYSQFGFKIKDTTVNNVADYMYAPKDSSSLAVTRILFGFAMLFDIPDERGGAIMEKRWDTKLCHFPLLPFIQPMRVPFMAVVYTGLWIGACGIMFGYKYRLTSKLFTVCYWYLFLIEKSFWNNHSYLFGLLAFLLTCTEANCFWSLDVYLDPSKKKTTVPYWNYFILKYQIFILYFMAGMKKGTAEWLSGYSVPNLSEHWVFAPFQLFLTVPQIDYLIVHCFIFIFDLTIAIWMMWSRTRHVAMVFCALFHLMNSRLFRIGMFPWVCLATMPLFYPFDWPKQVLRYYNEKNKNLHKIICKIAYRAECDCNLSDHESDDELVELFKRMENDYDEDYFDDVFEPIDNKMQTNPQVENKEMKILSTEEKIVQTNKKIQNIENDIATLKEKIKVMKDNLNKITNDGKDKKKRRRTLYLILFYVFVQAFLPYSHFITQGYNNWTNGLYGYSWDMMVHSWDTHSVLVKITDNENHRDLFLDPFVYTSSDRWTRHGDMIYQYAKCLQDKFVNNRVTPGFSKNLSIYFDIWSSMNGRFTQRLFDSKFDLLTADWSPFRKVEYLMPLLVESENWREKLDVMRKEVHSWNDFSDVIFFAEFPGYEQEKYISNQIRNVTLTLLEGTVAYEPEVMPQELGYSYKLTNGNRKSVDTGFFHKVKNIGNKPAFYMYTFYNKTEYNKTNYEILKPKLPIIHELYGRFEKMLVFFRSVIKSFYEIFYYTVLCTGDCKI